MRANFVKFLQLYCIRNSDKVWEDCWYKSYLRCSDPWPNCCQLQTVQRQSCQVWRFDQKVQIWRCPWFLAPGPPRRPWARTCHRWPRCSRHWFSLVGGQRYQHRIQLGQCRAHQKLSPRTKENKLEIERIRPKFPIIDIQFEQINIYLMQSPWHFKFHQPDQWRVSLAVSAPRALGCMLDLEILRSM